MAISTKVSIEIDGQPLNKFSKLVINQKVQSHHRFSLLQPLPKEFVSQAIDKAQKYIGQSIKIKVQPVSMSTTSPLVFNGIITEAQMVRTSGASGGIVINGYSPTILLEGSPNTKSFTDKSITDIAQEIFANYSSENLKPSVEINKDVPLP